MQSQQAPPNIHVAIVDDDDDIRTLLADFLNDNGITTSLASTAEELWPLLDEQAIDLLVLDLNLPGMDGLSICRQLRESSTLPVIMLTAKTSPLDRIVGLETGADDYLCKPFEPLELLSRIRSVLRRAHPLNSQPNGQTTDQLTEQANNQSTDSPAATDANKYYFAHWVLDIHARHLIDTDGEGTVVSLSGMEFNVLRCFLDHPNRILTRDQLMDLIHGRQAGPFDRAIDLQISRLRQKLEHDSKNPQIIKTVRSAGYVLTASVTNHPHDQ